MNPYHGISMIYENLWNFIRKLHIKLNKKKHPRHVYHHLTFKIGQRVPKVCFYLMYK